MSPEYYRSLIIDVLRTAGSSQPTIEAPPAPKTEPPPKTIEITIRLPLQSS